MQYMSVHVRAYNIIIDKPVIALSKQELYLTGKNKTKPMTITLKYGWLQQNISTPPNFTILEK